MTFKERRFPWSAEAHVALCWLFYDMSVKRVNQRIATREQWNYVHRWPRQVHRYGIQRADRQ